ncbi:DEAD-box ATP-dependent RNA helicase 52C isoform X1 [Dendrobium catenatum]|uniref:RNA helicase n=1 Tax=Dendrobium catenatum TaxID=906689 RepID=A0A2I0W9J4_9ASPA|nr:DEAD-box ATP-dependent RNA helicase 52C isoform X1 [Dendrobium catenatum]PKU72337.1 DEAD-box ATP-dependent RNA helicase 52C [Dendrobium catenatum]
MSGYGAWAESGASNDCFLSRKFAYIPPHLRHERSLASAAESGEAYFGARDMGHRAPRHGRGNRRASLVPNPFGIACNEMGNLRISDAGDGAGNVIDFSAYEDIPVETSGSDVPPPASTFAEIDLGEALNRNIQRCRYVNPTPVQRYAIPISLAGRDLMACAQTGSGKTAAFCFPIISEVMRSSPPLKNGRYQGGRLACPQALILSPTRELSCQIHDEAKKFSYQTGVRVGVVYGGAPAFLQLRNLEKGVDILVATPGRLTDLIERARISLQKVNYLVLDEADRMLDMGFEPQIRKIVEQMDMPPPGIRQTMLFSATFPHGIQRLASDFLKNYIFLTVGRVGSSTELIKQRVEFVLDMNKRNCLKALLQSDKVNGSHAKLPLTLIFVETKRAADSLQNWLCMKGFPASAIHGDRNQLEREQALKSFKSGATPIMVATDVASRGLDIPHVAHVINFDLPRDIDGYVHRIGRTGRAGKSGLATAFFNDANQPLAKALVELMQESCQEVPDWLCQYAGRPSSYVGERSRHHGGNRFGGQDFRKEDLQLRTGNYKSESYGESSCAPSHGDAGFLNNGDIKSGCSYEVGDDSCSAGADADYSIGAGDDNGDDTGSYNVRYDQIVATGWD